MFFNNVFDKPALNLKVRPFWVEHEGWNIEIAVFYTARRIQKKGKELPFAFNSLLQF